MKMSSKIIRIISVVFVAVMVILNVRIKSFAEESVIEVICIANENQDVSLAQIKELVQANYSQPSMIDVREGLSVYNADEDNYYFVYPIFNNGVCEYIAEVSTEGNVVMKNNASMINEIMNLQDGQYILYIIDGGLYAESNNNVIFINKEYLNQSNNVSFAQMTYYEKMNYIFQINTQMDYYIVNASNLSLVQNIEITEPGKYERNVITGTAGDKLTYKCNISDFVRQGNYQLCWAASAATVINYKLGISITPKYLADKQHIPYDKGGSIYEIHASLIGFGLPYTIQYSKISWSQIKSNINSDKPFVIGLVNTFSGHAITGYGYGCLARDTSSSARVIYAWDPNGSQISFLDTASNRITTSGQLFNWVETTY